MLPQHCRVIIWVDGYGRFSACAGYELATKGQDLRSRGFEPVCHFRAPLRRLRYGWLPVYRAAIGALCRMFPGWF